MNLRLRRLQAQDLPQINAFWEKHHKGIYGIPSRAFLVTDAVVENDTIAGYGIVRYFAEALLYLDKDKSIFTQAKTFKLLMDQAISDCKAANLDCLNVGVRSAEFERILKENYGFRDRDKVLILEF